MSPPVSVFLATRDDAIAQASASEGDVSGLFKFGGITDLEMSTLFSILAGEEFDFDRHEILPLDADTRDEIYELPEQLINCV
ncbi:MAG: hypothetical protein FWD68_02725 [Alphaproteobacteria bacterium]|nr:hypothetical protein [Alphaproteobacteria bacterium]